MGEWPKDKVEEVDRVPVTQEPFGYSFRLAEVQSHKRILSFGVR